MVEVEVCALHFQSFPEVVQGALGSARFGRGRAAQGALQRRALLRVALDGGVGQMDELVRDAVEVRAEGLGRDARLRPTHRYRFAFRSL